MFQQAFRNIDDVFRKEAVFIAELDCFGRAFQGAGVKTNGLFFDKGAPTRRVWVHQLDPGGHVSEVVARLGPRGNIDGIAAPDTDSAEALNRIKALLA